MRRFRNILVVSTGDTADLHVLDRVAALAERNDARVTLLHVSPTPQGDLARLFSGLPGRTGAALADEVMAERRAGLDAMAEKLRGHGLEFSTELAEGTDFIEIIRRVQASGHDLVAKMAGGAGAWRVMPSQDMHLMRKCPCPVWIFNGPEAETPRRILAAVEPDPTDPVRDRLNTTIMELATSMALWCDARLDVLSVWRLPEESTLRHSRIKLPASEVDALVEQERRASAWRLSELTAQFPQFADRMRVLHLKGMAADTIVEHTRTDETDLIVMGTLARSGVPGLLIGNTAETVLSQVRCAVLTVKPQGFVSPVEAN